LCLAYVQLKINHAAKFTFNEFALSKYQTIMIYSPLITFFHFKTFYPKAVSKIFEPFYSVHNNLSIVLVLKFDNLANNFYLSFIWSLCQLRHHRIFQLILIRYQYNCEIFSYSKKNQLDTHHKHRIYSGWKRC